MTREEAIEKIKKSMECHDRKVCGLAETCEECPLYVDKDTEYEAHRVLIKALSQEPRELLIIKSNILLHQDDKKKWAESIKREKESGVIILPPYFEPLLVPADIEINTDCGAKMESEDKE